MLGKQKRKSESSDITHCVITNFVSSNLEVSGKSPPSAVCVCVCVCVFLLRATPEARGSSQARG